MASDPREDVHAMLRRLARLWFDSAKAADRGLGSRAAALAERARRLEDVIDRVIERR